MDGNMDNSKQASGIFRQILACLVKPVLRSTAVLVLMGTASICVAGEVPMPVATDSRIKTYVYNENDVFSIVTHYGYQSNIEFGKDEDIETISVGDRVPFQIIPAGRRLFIRAMLANARTNMTVVTNKHAYQFDLISMPAPMTPSEELVYVVRFFYPGDRKNSAEAYSAGDSAPPAAIRPAAVSGNAYNYHYTYSGSSEITPLKIFDDGRSTYFKLRSAVSSAPSFFKLDEAGKQVPVSSYNNGEYWVVDGVSPRFSIKEGDYTVSVYNEKPVP